MWKSHLLVKTVIWAQNRILLVKTSPKVCSIFKKELENIKNQNDTQNSVIGDYREKHNFQLQLIRKILDSC